MLTMNRTLQTVVMMLENKAEFKLKDILLNVYIVLK